MIDLIGAVRRLHGHNRSERHHLAPPIAHLELGDVLGSRPKGSVGLCDHLVRATEFVEVVDVLGAEVDLQGREEIIETNVELLCLVAVDIREELRHVDLESGELTGECRRLIGLAEQGLRRGVECRVAEPCAIFELELESANRTESVDGGWRGDTHERVPYPAQLLVERQHDRAPPPLLTAALPEPLCPYVN